MRRRFGVVRSAALAAVLLLSGMTDPTRSPVNAASVPPNDFFAFANDVTALPYVDADVNTALASTEPLEPRDSCYRNQFSINYSVWYRLTAPATTTISAIMAPAMIAGRDIKGIVVAYEGSDLSALIQLGCASTITENGPVHLAFNVVAGRTYYVQVGSWSLSGPGVFDLSIRQQIPANDFFAFAHATTALPYLDSGVNTALAGAEPNEPRESCYGNNDAINYSVWYKLVAPATTAVSAVMTPASFTSNDLSGIVVAYEGTDLETLTVLGCASAGNNRNAQVHVSFKVTAGHTYYVQVGSWLSRGGIFDFTLRDTRAPSISVTAPTASFVAGAAIGASGVPVRLSWTGVGTGISRYQVALSTNGGAYVVLALSAARSTSLVRAFRTGSTGYRIRVRAFDAAGHASAWSYGPTFHLRLVQDSSSSIAYSGTWRQVSSSSASGGTLRRTTRTGASASYTFTGRAIAWIAPKDSTGGVANVTLDGAIARSVSLSASTSSPRRIVFAQRWGSSGRHTIGIAGAGTPGHPRVDVDAFVVLW